MSVGQCLLVSAARSRHARTHIEVEIRVISCYPINTHACRLSPQTACWSVSTPPRIHRGSLHTVCKSGGHGSTVPPTPAGTTATAAQCSLRSRAYEWLSFLKPPCDWWSRGLDARGTSVGTSAFTSSVGTGGAPFVGRGASPEPGRVHPWHQRAPPRPRGLSRPRRRRIRALRTRARLLGLLRRHGGLVIVVQRRKLVLLLRAKEGSAAPRSLRPPARPVQPKGSHGP